MGRRASPRCWHVVRKHADRLVCAPPSFIVSADTARRRVASRSFSPAESGVQVRGTPGPFVPVGTEAARTAEPRRLCLKVERLGPPSLRIGPGTLFASDGVFSQSEECDSGPPDRPRASVPLES